MEPAAWSNTRYVGLPFPPCPCCCPCSPLWGPRDPQPPPPTMFSGGRSKGLTPIGSGVLELLQVKPSAWKQGMNREGPLSQKRGGFLRENKTWNPCVKCSKATVKTEMKNWRLSTRKDFLIVEIEGEAHWLRQKTRCS